MFIFVYAALQNSSSFTSVPDVQFLPTLISFPNQDEFYNPEPKPPFNG